MNPVKALFLSLVFLLGPRGLVSQNKYDFQWILGGSSSGDGVRIDFHEMPPAVLYQAKDMRMEGSNTSICDKDGNLLFYSNGCFIANAQHEVMVNGDTISPGLLQEIWCPSGGSPTAQGVLALPAPGSDSLYYLFNLDLDDPYFMTSYTGIAPERLYYQVIDRTVAGGLGAVIAKNQLAVQDTFARGGLQAIRHANGENWWVVVPKSHSNCYFILEVTPDGVQSPFLECAGTVWNDNDGAQAVFSPDGTTYARMNFQNGLHIYDFNTATGSLSNPVVLSFDGDDFPTIIGAAISPNSRFLYASAGVKLYQYDLEADPISQSQVTVAEWDGFQNPLPTNFYLSALGPDGRIYISSSNSTLNLHVIQQPDCPGLACQVEQHGIDLPWYNFASIPNLPHYRSYPTGVECDSVVLAGPGVIKPIVHHSVVPNPGNGIFFLRIDAIEKVDLLVFDAVGRLILEQPVQDQQTIINLAEQQDGLYTYCLKGAEGYIGIGRIVKGP